MMAVVMQEYCFLASKPILAIHVEQLLSLVEYKHQFKPDQRH